MPYKSDAQRRFFHSPGAAKAGIKPATVAEFDQASKGMSLPARAGLRPDGGMAKSMPGSVNSTGNRKSPSTMHDRGY